MDTRENDDYSLADEPRTMRSGVTAPGQIPVYMPAASTPPRRKWSLLRFVVRSLFTLMVLISLGVNIYFIMLFSGGVQTAIYQSGNLEQKIALIDLNESISMATVDFFRQSLQKAAHDETVKGIILVVDSPGGAVVPSDMITQALIGVKESSGKPVYAAIEQVGASGAYWIASSADQIYAQRHSMVGSIGVIYINMVLEQGFKEKLGIEPVVIKSSRSQFKDKGSPFRRPTETEILSIQSDLDTIHRHFVEVVSRNRRLTVDQVWELASGDVYDGDEALQNHLIDKVGTLSEAINDMSNDLGLADPTVVHYSRRQSFGSLLSGESASRLAALDIPGQLEKLIRHPRIQALWLGQ